MLYETQLAYYDDAYQTTLKSEILRVEQGVNEIAIYLDATIFYPYGGGQPADQGTITTKTGKANVRNVLIKNGIVQHVCQVTDGQIEEEQQATLTLDWERRHKNMRVHSAGHIIHDVLLQMTGGLTPARGDHGSKPYIEYVADDTFDITPETLEAAVNQIISEGRAVICRETTAEELAQLAQFPPPHLSPGKKLRMMQIEGYSAMADGGTQVRNINDIGRVEIASIENKEGKMRLKYRVHDPV